MKNIFLGFCGAFLAFFGFISFVGSADAIESLGGYEIKNYEVNIAVDENSSFDVEERIQVNFLEPRHGIYRYIPVDFKDDKGFQHNFRFNLISVKDGKGDEYNIAEKGKKNGDYMIKIGDADSYVEGENTYLIKYRVQNAFRFFYDH
jgi:hypothetical protein